MRSVLSTLRLMLYTLLPPRRQEGVGSGEGKSSGDEGREFVGQEERRMAPVELRRGMEQFLDNRQELRLFFPGCLPAAAPFVLFRLKREGFSRCTVRAGEDGLHVQGRR